MKHASLSRHQCAGLIVLIVILTAVTCALRGIDTCKRRRRLAAVEAVCTDSLSATFSRHTPVRLQPFDPNTADSLTLLGLGLTERQVRGILRYRRKGGRYREPADFCFNMSDSVFRALRPFIRIDTMPQHRADSARRALHDSLYHAYWDSVRQARRDSLDSVFLVRRDSLLSGRILKRDTVLELNTADTLSLQMLRGVGPATARCIVAYRERLGGYCDAEQLREIPQLQRYGVSVDSLLPHLTVDTTLIRKIDVNHVGLDGLRRHPYVQPFAKARALYEWRRVHTRIRSERDLRSIRELNEQDILRLRPYLSFE